MKYQHDESTWTLGEGNGFQNTQIWIGENISITCIAHYNWFQKIMIRFFFGWVIKKIK